MGEDETAFMKGRMVAHDILLTLVLSAMVNKQGASADEISDLIEGLRRDVLGSAHILDLPAPIVEQTLIRHEAAEAMNQIFDNLRNRIFAPPAA